MPVIKDIILLVGLMLIGVADYYSQCMVMIFIEFVVGARFLSQIYNVAPELYSLSKNTEQLTSKQITYCIINCISKFPHDLEPPDIARPQPAIGPPKNYKTRRAYYLLDLSAGVFNFVVGILISLQTIFIYLSYCHKQDYSQQNYCFVWLLLLLISTSITVSICYEIFMHKLSMYTTLTAIFLSNILDFICIQIVFHRADLQLAFIVSLVVGIFYILCSVTGITVFFRILKRASLVGSLFSKKASVKIMYSFIGIILFLAIHMIFKEYLQYITAFRRQLIVYAGIFLLLTIVILFLIKYVQLLDKQEKQNMFRDQINQNLLQMQREEAINDKNIAEERYIIDNNNVKQNFRCNIIDQKREQNLSEKSLSDQSEMIDSSNISD